MEHENTLLFATCSLQYALFDNHKNNGNVIPKESFYFFKIFFSNHK